MQGGKLKGLLKSAQFIETSLNDISDDFGQGRKASDYPKRTPCDYLVSNMDVREGLRKLAEGIQDNRKAGELQKEQIERKKVLLQGLQYYKATLVAKIKECGIEVSKIDEYISRPVEVQNWSDGYEETEHMMQEQLKQREAKEQEFNELVGQKSKLEERAKEKKELHELVLPSKARSLLSQIREASQLLGTQMEEQMPEARGGQIRGLLDMLQSLKTRGLIEVAYSGQQECEQVEMVMLASKDCQYYTQAQQSSINIQQQSFKLSIVDLSPQHPQLLIGVDRREQFTNEEVFQGLIGHHPASLPFTNPNTEAQRNINSKYISADWLQHLVRPTQLTPQEFFNRVRRRVFTLQLISYLRENTKKLNYYFPLPRDTTIPANFKKVMNASLQKITFEEYLGKVHLPDWVQKYRNALLASHDTPEFTLFESVLGQLGLEEVTKPNRSRYMHGQLTFMQNKLEFVLAIPVNYPDTPSRITLVSHHRFKQEQQKKAALPAQLQVISRLGAKTETVTDWMLATEKVVNSDIAEYETGQYEKTPFRVLLQLNRLMTLFVNYDRKQ